MNPDYDLDKIKFSIDKPIFDRAVELYETGKIKNFKKDYGGYSAVVIGTQPYEVSVSNKNYDCGNCDCYLGQKGVLCKHMISVAICAVTGDKELNKIDKELISSPECSNKLGEMSEEDFAEVKKTIATSIKYIKAYQGPSKTWFSYQNSLTEGVRRLSDVVSKLPISLQSAELLVSMLLRLDKKLCVGGVDDSNGIIGGFIDEIVDILKDYAKLDPKCIKAFKKLRNQETCFSWEESLLKLLY